MKLLVFFLCLVSLSAFAQGFPADDASSSVLPSGTRFTARVTYDWPAEGRLIYKNGNEIVNDFSQVGVNDHFCAVFSPGGQVLERIPHWWILYVERVDVVRDAFIRIWTNNTNGYEVEFRCSRGNDGTYFQGIMTVGELKKVLLPYFTIGY